MKTDDKNQGIVVECYNHDASHRVLEVYSQETRSYFFFYVSMFPQIDFGDIILMNPAEDKFYVLRGNSKLTYKITPLAFPDTLLMELISERMNL